MDQFKAYDAMKDKLERDHFGRWVIIHEGMLKGHYDSYEGAEAAVDEMDINATEYLLKLVGAEPNIIISLGKPKRVKVEVSQYQVPMQQLEDSGPLIPILIDETTGVALLDTGARRSVIDLVVARRLGLRESGEHRITGATGVGTFPSFDIELQIPWLDTTVPAPIGGAPLRANGIPWHAIIGRDIILKFDFHMDGATGSISFLKETETGQ